jgi:adenosylcobinamide kinase/adenosylcobinamide-phosphate guanylyltransferase
LSDCVIAASNHRSHSSREKQFDNDSMAQSPDLSMTQFLTPWSATVEGHTLIVSLPTLYRVLSWAPLNGGFCQARSLLNHQVDIHAHPAEEPEAFLAGLAQRLLVKEPVVGLMTGVRMERLVRRVSHHREFTVECFVTVGLSNALAVGDPATYDERPGTINVIVVVNQPLTDVALVEAVGIVTEAKTRALHEARVTSTVSGTLATGTGTDCVAIACPSGAPMLRYCGKHTAVGEVIGREVYEAVVVGVQRALGNNGPG